METNIIFKFGGEGGAIGITKENNKFIYNHHEFDVFDSDDEPLYVNKREEFDNFDEPFLKINQYLWHYLYAIHIHDEYKDYIANELIKKLNNTDSPDNPDLSKRTFSESWEEKLNIKIQFDKNNGKYYLI